MERTRKATGRRQRFGGALLGAAAIAAVLAGCGPESQYANRKRPPSPITLTAYIGHGRVSVSPARFGAGPIMLVVTNQTPHAQQLTLESDQLGSDKPGITQSTGRINPQETATIQADVRTGAYIVHTANDGVHPARLVVGKRRSSAQNELLLP